MSQPDTTNNTEPPKQDTNDVEGKIREAVTDYEVGIKRAGIRLNRNGWSDERVDYDILADVREKFISDIKYIIADYTAKERQLLGNINGINIETDDSVPSGMIYIKGKE